MTSYNANSEFPPKEAKRRVARAIHLNPDTIELSPHRDGTLLKISVPTSLERIKTKLSDFKIASTPDHVYPNTMLLEGSLQYIASKLPGQSLSFV